MSAKHGLIAPTKKRRLAALAEVVLPASSNFTYKTSSCRRTLQVSGADCSQKPTEWARARNLQKSDR